MKLDNPLHGSITFNLDGTYSYVPNVGYFGNDSLHYKVCDLGMPILCDTATLYIGINFVNQKPVAVDTTFSTAEDNPLSNSIAANVTDVDGNLNPSSFVLTDSPLHGTIVLNSNGTFTYTPVLNFFGTDSVHYKVCDYLGLCDTAAIV